MNLTECASMARKLIDEHINEREPYVYPSGVTLPKGLPWRFEFDNAAKRFGCCHYSLRKITLSRQLVAVNTETVVRETVLHEIAHALAYTVNGETGHGRAWQQWCVRLGIKPERCYTPTTSPVAALREARGERVVQPAKAPYYLLCVACGKTHPRFRRTAKRFWCGSCFRKNGGVRTDAILMRWRTSY